MQYDFTYLGEQLVMLSRFNDIWIDCTYIHTSDWSGSCSEEGPLFGDVSPRPPRWAVFWNGVPSPVCMHVHPSASR